MTDATGWNSLEVAKLLVALLTPLAVAVLGIAVTRASKRAEAAADAAARAAEDAQWANRRVVERLIELHQEMAPLLNDIYCFFRLVGHFRSISPPALLECKRKLDRLFYTNEYLFQESFRHKYHDFMRECFDQWASAGKDALIKASPEWHRVERGPGVTWHDDWNYLYRTPDDAEGSIRTQQRAYKDAMSAFAAEIGIRPQPISEFPSPVRADNVR